ncbi:dihydroxyacetone kinase phosphoryl donor subunit DhaM [Listeria sp. PSOL-1]|uniref:dihydroxyacetone kinase phosphoryl donor subunit DhaM n=1 Tax=Listeria sp. PSOL-1 TaxID=1844999 RepID=UPI0013CF7A4D|nr:dihydroxyacetone kinase phosphoryl donor subunit DhaM [Listeria sp. PSOL-1]
MTKDDGIVIISHSKDVARGIYDLIKQIAADVPITYAGGTEDDGIGTSFDKVNQAFEKNPAQKIYAFYDLGSAKMNIETVKGLSDKEIFLCNAPILEGAYVAAAQLQIDGDEETVKQTLQPIEIK